MDAAASNLSTLTEQLNRLYEHAHNKQALESEPQPSFSLFLQNLKSYLTESHAHIDPAEFSAFCHRISKIERSYSIPEELLKTICILSTKILTASNPNSLLSIHNLYNASAKLIHTCIHPAETFQWLFIDGQHEWKQQKYEQVLKSIIEAFKEKNSDLTTTYLELKAIDKEKLTPLQKFTLNWLSPLLVPSNNSKEAYRQFISHLRISCKYLLDLEQQPLLDSADPLVQLTLNSCYYRFSEVHLYSFCEKLVKLLLQDGIKNLNPHNPPLEVLGLPLRLQFEAIQAASQQLKEPQICTLIQKSSATTNLWYDPQIKSNIPYVLCDLTLSSNHPLRILRMGTPTASAEGITPEYKLFLISCQKKNEKVFYVSEQAENSWIESGRNLQIKQLCNDYPKTFFMIVLPNDSPFYHQTTPFDEPFQIFQEFKELFKTQLQSAQTGFYFEKSWLEHPSFMHRIDECLKEIHEDVFCHASLLAHKQRLDFIEIAYARIILEMINFLKIEQQTLIKFLFLICRDGNDRAVKTLVTLVSLCLLYLGNYQTPEYQKMLNVFIHSPKMLVMKSEMNERRERLISVSETLSQPEVMLRLGLRQKNHQIVTGFSLKSEKRDRAVDFVSS